jgi:RND family efflux transporter MFP subunit
MVALRVSLRGLALTIAALSLPHCGPTETDSGGGSGMPYTSKAPGAPTTAQGTLVRAQTLRTGEIRTTIEAPTDIEAEIVVDVFPKVGPAYIKEVLVKEGDRVDSGMPLLTLDDVDFRLAKKRAESDLLQAQQKITVQTTALSESQARQAAQKAVFEKAELDYQRAKDSMVGGIDVLSKKELADIESAYLQQKAEYDGVRFAVDRARDDLESARLAVKAAELDLEEAQTELDLTIVRAPIAGIIQRRDVNAGLLVNSSTHLFTLVDPTLLIANLAIDQRKLALLREPGLRVEFTIDALPGRVVSGTIEAINPTVDPSSGQARVRARLEPGSEAYVLPGMYANARIVIGSRSDAVLLPKRAVVNEDGRQYFFAVVDGKLARRHEITTGASTPNEYELLTIDGAAPTTAFDAIIVGQDKLQDGDAVVVVGEGS